MSLLTDTTPAVTQTINNIVQKTIEQVTTGTTTPTIIKTAPAPVLSESDQVMFAVGGNLSKLASIRDKASDGASATSTAKIGIGTIISSDGLIATDNSILGDKTEFIVFFGDKYRFAKKVYFDDSKHLAFLQTEDPVKDNINMQGIVFSPVLYSAGDLRLGLSLIALGGENGKSMTRGSVTEIPDKKTSPLLAGDMMLASSYRGGIVFGLDGKVIGFILSSPLGTPQIIQYGNVLSALTDYKTPKPTAVKL